jgi:RNA polymerase sigma-70 factor, ECF subfamily
MIEIARLPGSRQPMDPSDPDPGRLMNRFARKDPEAAGELYRRFAPRIFGLGTLMLGDHTQAEELVQDFFVNLWRDAAEFDPAQGSLDEWVLRIALKSIRRR